MSPKSASRMVANARALIAQSEATDRAIRSALPRLKMQQERAAETLREGLALL